MPVSRSTLFRTVVLLAALVTARVPAAPPGPVEGALDKLQRTGDFETAAKALERQFDRVIAAAPLDDRALFTDAAFAVRLIGQLNEVDDAIRLELLEYLRTHDQLASTLVFLVKPDQEKAAEVYALLDRLRRARGEALETYPNLAAALCVVHEEPFKRRFNENTARSADPIAIFDYFVVNERRTLFGVRNVPAELLIYVVDTTASIEEMTWALNRYAGDPVVGARFFDIKYDKKHFRKGAPKKVTVAGWNLPNMLRYGGVCVDQAYFAMTVGKSIGVPTAYASGAGSKVSHAWVGFLQARDGQARWNFDVGRYPAYQGVRGRVLDPQVRQRIPDSDVSLLAELSTVPARDRWAAAAYTEAAVRLRDLAEAGAGLNAGLDDGEATGAEAVAVRKADVESTLALVEQGLRISPGYAPGWMVMRDLAAADRLTLEQKKRWAGVLHRLCGARYPDFYLAILRPMIESIDDVREQDALWNKAFVLFRDRHDLAASVRMSQGRMWERAGEPMRAGACYEDVILRYANAGPFVIPALKRAEKILWSAGRPDKVLELYDRAFRSIRRPGDMGGPFYHQSNWYRVGMMCVNRLEKAGHNLQAASMRANIEALAGP
ncbi:MAG: hypothetical protein ACYS0G_14275 [Planctomycetota bacterium]|jgi:hypothetical protein